MRRHKLAKLAGIRGISYSALSALLNTLAQVGALSSDVATSSTSIRRHVEEDLGFETAYGRVLKEIDLPLEDGGVFRWAIVCPLALLSWLATFSVAFAEMMLSKLGTCTPDASAPWSILLYLDECSPGNLLAIEHRRKAWQVYWGFAELGSLLNSEHTWFFFGTIRATIAAKVAGGVSCIARAIIRSFFGETHSFGVGITIKLKDEVHIVVAKLMSVIGDEAALKHFWSVKGASGTKVCFKCVNVVSSISGLIPFSAGGIVAADCSDISRFTLHSDESLWAAADKAHRHRHSPTTQFARLTQALGIAYHKAMLLLDCSLRQIAKPISCGTFDWVHIWLVNGIANVELFSILTTLKQHISLKYEHIDKFFQCWHWPSQSHNAPRGAFSQARAAASTEKFKAGASEILDMYPVLRCFFDRLSLKSMDEIKAQVSSAYALFDVLDILGSHPATDRAADELLAAHTQHMQLHRSAYPGYHMIPKWHYAFHIPSQIKQHHHLFGTFAHERKHKSFKLHGAQYCNTIAFERSMAKILLNTQLHKLMDETTFCEGDHLVQPTEEKTSFASLFSDFGNKVFMSTRCVHGEVRLASGDVVLYHDSSSSACLVKAELFIRVEDPLRGHVHMLLGCVCSHLANDVWAVGEDVLSIDFSKLVRPLIWSHVSEGIRVIMPAR